MQFTVIDRQQESFKKLEKLGDSHGLIPPILCLSIYEK